MFKTRISIFVLCCGTLSFAAAHGQIGSSARGNTSTGVVLRLAEPMPIEGVTELAGFPVGEGGALAYYHKAPALVVSPGDVDRLIVRRTKLSPNSSQHDGFSVTVHLTADARQRVAAKAVHGNGTRFVAAFVDGRKSRVLLRYEIKKTSGVPKQCQAGSFTPMLLFLHSEARIQDVVGYLIDG